MSQEELAQLKKQNAKLRSDKIEIESDLVTVVGTLRKFGKSLGIDFSKFQGEGDISSSLPQLLVSVIPKISSGGLDLGEVKAISPILNKYQYLMEEIESNG